MSTQTPDNLPYAQPIGAPIEPIAEDLYCLTCGYNLRGLTGDPVRCPECGGANEVAALQVPAPMIRAALRRLETAPTLCVACALFALVLIGFVLLFTLLLRVSPWVSVMCGLLALLCVVAWVPALVSVRRAFRGQAGWGRVVVGFHAAGLLLISWYPLLLGLAIVSDVMRVQLPQGAGWVVLILALALFMWGLSIYRDAKRRMAVIRRDTAVSIAREKLRKALNRSGDGAIPVNADC